MEPSLIIDWISKNPVYANFLGWLRDRAPDTYVVGGAVRDAIACERDEPADLDVMLGSLDRNVFHELRERYRNEERYFGNVRLHIEDAHIDVMSPAQFRSGYTSVSEAIAHFDLSVNAMAVRVDGQDVLDPLGGRADIMLGQIRKVRSRWSRSSDSSDLVDLENRLGALRDRYSWKLSPAMA